MKTTVFCATLLCLELVSAYPFPEPLPSYYGSYEPVGVPEQRIVSQKIPISNLAHSQNSELAYQQQQLGYLQQENSRRQNNENLLRNQEQQALNQRIESQLLIPAQPQRNYKSPVPLNTVREPYINSIPLQHPIQNQYEMPTTQQNYQNQQVSEPYRTVKAPRQIQVQNAEPQSVVEHVTPAQNYHYNRQYQSVPHYKPQNVLYNPRIQEALATTPLKKRYLVLHPNGTVEHIDKIENIVKRYPNYILLKSGDLPKPNEAVTPRPVQPVPPLEPGVVANEKSWPVAPAAPLTLVVPPTRGAPSPDHSVTTTAKAGNLTPTILNGTVPGPKPTVPSSTDSTTTPKSVTTPKTFQPQPLSTTLAPPPIEADTAPAVKPPQHPGSTTPLPPTKTANPTVTPPSSDTTPVTIEHPTVTPSIESANSAVDSSSPSDTISTNPRPTPNTDLTVTPPSVTGTDTAAYPTTSTPEVTNENQVTPAPAENDSIDDSKSPEATSTNVTSVENQCDENDTDTESTGLDLPFDKIPAKPIVWFRSTDMNFFDKLTSGNETFDIVYFFNVPREPRVLKDTKTTIHANGTVVEEITETIYDDEDAPPRVVKTTKVTNPDDSPPET